MMVFGVFIGRMPDLYNHRGEPVEHRECLLDGTVARIIDKDQIAPERGPAGHFTGRYIDLRI